MVPNSPGIYYVGIIDVLQEWDCNKKMERWVPQSLIPYLSIIRLSSVMIMICVSQIDEDDLQMFMLHMARSISC